MTPDPRLAVRAAIVFTVLWLAVPTGPTAAQTAAPDDRPWTLGETDCVITNDHWRVSQSTDEYHTGPTCRRIYVNAGWGTKILTSCPVPHCYVIDELKPSLWIKATRPHIQFHVRVVLPNTADPREDGPMTVLLPGPVYKHSGRWQKLDFADLPQSLPELLQQAVWKLRARFDGRIDDSQAYVDRLVLNLYAGPGSNTVWIDDVELPGTVPVNLNSRHVGVDARAPEWPVHQVGYQEPLVDRRPALARCNSTILEVRGQPFFARLIQHNGEPFEMLRELGFNTIELPRTASIQQLRQAERLDLWIVCPPPASAGLDPISTEFDRVLAWTLDTGQQLADINGLANRVQEIRRSDIREDRPIVAFANTHMYDLSRVCDILGVGFEPIGGSFALGQYSDWVQQRTQLAQRSMPVWATVQTELPETIARQTAALAATVPPLPLDPAQIRDMTYEAIAGGARGLRFVSRSRLDAGDPVARLRGLMLRWLNAHLRHLEPWVCGGAVVNRTESSDRSQQLTTLSTPRGRLILIQRSSQSEPGVAGDASVSTFKFSDSALGTSEQPFHLSETGLVLLDQGRVLAGNEITIENCGPLEAVVITGEPVVINRMAESYLLAGEQTQSQMHLEIVRQWLAIAQLINEQLARMGQGRAPASGSINEANNALRQAQMLVASGSAMTANRMLFVADQKLAAARRDILLASRSQFNAVTSSPLLSHIALVPLHYDLTSRIDPASWQANGLAGGDFENLQLMTDNQWENHRATLGGVRTHVELATSPVVRGRSSLLLSVDPDEGNPAGSLVDRTPLWIRSGPVPVRAGQLVRIHGWVNIQQPVSGSLEGLRIVDSIGGPDLAERIVLTRGWQEFSIYRCPAEDTQLRLTFELTGFGAASLDEVSVNVLNLAGSAGATLQEARESRPDGSSSPATTPPTPELSGRRSGFSR